MSWVATAIGVSGALNYLGGQKRVSIKKRRSTLPLTKSLNQTTAAEAGK